MACVTACPSGVQYDKLIEATRAADRAQLPAHARRPAVPAAAASRCFRYPGRLRRRSPPRSGSTRPRACSAWSRRSGAARPPAAAPAGDGGAAAAAVAGEALRAARPGRVAARGPAAAAGRPAARLRAARLLRRCQRRHGARAGRRGLRGDHPARAGLLRRAAGPRRAGGRRAGHGPPYHRRCSSAAQRGYHRHQRGGLRLDDERIRPPAARRPGLRRPRPRLRRQVQRHHPKSWPSWSRARRAIPLPLRVAYHDACHLQHAQGIVAQPRAVLAHDPRAWRSRRDRRVGASAAARRASTTWSSPSRPRNWATARRATSSTTGAEIAGHRATPAACCKSSTPCAAPATRCPPCIRWS